MNLPALKVGAISALLLVCAAAQAQQAPASPADTDPIKMGWMQGSPPPPERRIRFQDGRYYQFPKTRWSFAQMRELVPTARISRGPGRASRLPVALRSDLVEVTFTPLLRTDRMSWSKAFEAVYGDAVLILHKGKNVYERYNGVMDRDRPHLAFSVTKSYFGTLAEMLIADGKLTENATVGSYIPEMVIVRFASNPKAANANYDDISLPAYQAIAERLLKAK